MNLLASLREQNFSNNINDRSQFTKYCVFSTTKIFNKNFRKSNTKKKITLINYRLQNSVKLLLLKLVVY